MGCGTSVSPGNVYTKEHVFDKLLPKSSPVYTNTKIENFEDIEKKWMNETFLEKLILAFKLFALKECLGYRKREGEKLASNYTFFTYEEVQIMSENLSYNFYKRTLAELKDYGEEGKLRMMGIYSRNCVEWLLTDIACQMDSITVVPLYDTLGQIAIEHICNQTQLSTLCISSENTKKFLDLKSKFALESLKNIVVFDLTMLLTQGDFDLLQKTGLSVHKFSDLIKEIPLNERKAYNLKPPKPESILTICFTSGTTSLPKGAKISQRCVNAQLITCWDSGAQITQKDIHLSYLPLAHIMERVSTSILLAYGGAIGFISGDIRKSLSEDLKALHPTFLVAVPKVLANFKDTIMTKISELTGCKRSMIERAIRNKRENFQKNMEINDSFYDTFVFNKIHEEFGGKWRFILTGSAPLSIELGNDIKIIFGCPLIEGYGLTETGGAVLCTNVEDKETGYCGGPVGTAKIRLEDCEELNYTSKNRIDDKPAPCGEICVKGPCVFSGYFNDKENTSKIFDQEGWLHTGDVGLLSTEQRKIKIVDRIKEIFKLNQGEYIAPAKLETAYSKCEYVSQICVYGQSLKTYIIAIITPKPAAIEKFLKSKEWYKNDAVDSHYENNELLAEIKRSLDQIADSCKFNSLEKVQKVIISREEFTIDNELLTPTAKLVRRKIEQKFKEQIDKIYI